MLQSPTARQVNAGAMVCAPSAATYTTMAAAGPVSLPFAVKRPGAIEAKTIADAPANWLSRITFRPALPSAIPPGKTKLIWPEETYRRLAPVSAPDWSRMKTPVPPAALDAEASHAS